MIEGDLHHVILALLAILIPHHHAMQDLGLSVMNIIPLLEDAITQGM